MEEAPVLIHLHGVPEYVTYSYVVMLILALSALLVRRRLQLVPRGMQNVLEVAVESLLKIVDATMGKDGERYFPLIATLGLFILLSNLLGLIPGFMSPTSNLNTTAACAVIVFFIYNYEGIRVHGLGAYLKHFMGPMPLLAPLMFPIEIISHLARPLSLSMRLFGNIFGEDKVLFILFLLVPFFVPLPMMAFAIFTSFLQAFVFMLLSMIYIGGAIEHAHDPSEHVAEGSYVDAMSHIEGTSEEALKTTRF